MAEKDSLKPSYSYMPFAGNHSIVECAIALHFASTIQPDVLSRVKAELSPKLAAELPSEEQTKVLAFAIESGGVEAPIEQLGGFALRRLKSDGRPARMLRFLHDLVSVNHVAYDTWNAVRERSIAYLESALSSLDLSQNPVVATSLRFIDRFTFDGPIAEASAATVFDEKSIYIASICLNAGNKWHCNTGWFSEVGEGRPVEVLNQLNLTATTRNKAASLTIDHNQVMRFSNRATSIDAVLRGSQTDSRNLTECWDAMHDDNKKSLKSLLQAEVARKIGLL